MHYATHGVDKHKFRAARYLADSAHDADGADPSTTTAQQAKPHDKGERKG
ncbi:hypothetical protein P4N68_06670 [Corynebacterium felinum]|uniref:Uncharacterized protein n=1 Tax=Corynebacterium felinum TaxID=131318 RepID=A0ABU2B6D1_9CORY|nr:hypothetical protein [Corynebacterium felinum]MDF5820764.1 hypothetical protein [Corynebacterium felinum]MDR7354182.1 hypothetical protein [Corynebacterium felinum]